MSDVKVTVIIALERAGANLAEILNVLDLKRHPEAEVIVVHTGEAEINHDTEGPQLAYLLAPRGARIPHLWREGIRAARGALVATTTAHCIPSGKWLSQLTELGVDENRVGVGGSIENPDHAPALSWAIYLQRYGHYTPDHAQQNETRDIAADNAVYWRAAIAAHEDLLAEGFWEPSFHARFFANKQTLAYEPALTVIHENRYSLHEYLGQRFAHGSEFGYSRARSKARLTQLALLLGSPLLTLVFFVKILSRARQHDATRKGIVKALPLLTICLVAWGLGEARGYWRASFNR
ncbi:MAG: glycosyltransferase [Pseudomonadota bacterium]